MTPERALIFRITHRDNVPHIVEHGIHCRTSPDVDPHFVEIGNPDIIGRRMTRGVPVPPGGALADYVPFYFTPCTPMLYNIVTGRNGLTLRPRAEIVVLVSSLDLLEAHQIPYVVADRNAALLNATLAGGRGPLANLVWPDWRNRDFKRVPDDPGKFERYQAEALVFGHLPCQAIQAIITYDKATQLSVSQAVSQSGIGLQAFVRTDWYP